MKLPNSAKFPFRNRKLVIRNLRSFTLIELLVPTGPLRGRPCLPAGRLAIHPMPKSRKSFTLIELLVVLAIVAILSVVVIMTLNPSELLKQARDSNRLSDLSTLNTALSAYSADVNGGFMGTSTVVYVSIPDTSPTCDNLGLPTSTGAGFTYHCATAENLKRADGQGWIPVNFSNISFGSPLSSLPVDPTNTTSSGNYYTYVSGGSFILTALPESQKQKTALSSNPNISNYPGVIAVGNNLSLSPLYNPSGLVGYWNFDEGSGTTAADSSGNGNAGTIIGTTVVPGKIGSARAFNSSSDMVTVPDNGVVLDPASITMSAWIYPTLDLVGDIISKNGNSGYRYRRNTAKTATFYDRGGTNAIGSNNTIPLGAWSMLTVTGNASGLKIYINGILDSSNNSAYGPGDNADSLYIGVYGPYSEPFTGNLDDVRVYNRALSAAEILALYNSTK